MFTESQSLKPACEEIPKHPRPRLLRLALPRFDRQHRFAPVLQGARCHLLRSRSIEEEATAARSIQADRAEPVRNHPATGHEDKAEAEAR